MTLLAAAVTFAFTVLLTIAGVGAAFILIPVFVALGIDLRAAMATALLLNAIAAAVASVRNVRKGLVDFRVAVPILVVASALAPLGARASHGLDRRALLGLFVAFLAFAGGMMLFHRPKARPAPATRQALVAWGTGLGAVAGFLGGLLGVGGGNVVVPVLVWLGFEPKRASATTSFVVVFSSLAGFLGHATLGSLAPSLVVATGAAAAAGALAGSWLMTERLRGGQVRTVLGVVLLAIAVKMGWGLVR